MTDDLREGVMKPVFVFGSNLAGRHGKGAALYALQNEGAVYGQGVGRQGNSYAIPTKDENLTVMTLDDIDNHVYAFLVYPASMLMKPSW